VTSGADAEAPSSPAARVRTPVKAAVYGYLAVVILTAALGANWWPLTSWRLFSGVRGPTVAGWSIRTVGADGRESAFDPATAGRPFHMSARLADHWSEYSPTRRAAVCSAWAHAAARVRPGVRLLRLYRTLRAVPRHGRRWRIIRATLRYQCTVGGA
jgi:hypothetical protein